MQLRSPSASALWGTAACVAVIQCALPLTLSPNTASASRTLARLAALLTARQLIANTSHPRTDAPRLAAYAAALFAIFPAYPRAITQWVQLTPCATAPNAITIDSLDLVVDRALTAALAAVIFCALLPSIEQRSTTVGHRIPGPTSISFMAALIYLGCWSVATWMRNSTHMEPWCERITDADLTSSARTFAKAASGPVEEFAFTGFALLLLIRCRWPTIAAGAVINVVTRTALHLYYADHHTVGLWALWVLLWSGCPLLIAFAVGRRALRAGMPARQLVVVYTLTAVAAHSFCDLSSTRTIALALLALALTAAPSLLISPSRGPLFWLVPET